MNVGGQSTTFQESLPCCGTSVWMPGNIIATRKSFVNWSARPLWVCLNEHMGQDPQHSAISPALRLNFVDHSALTIRKYLRSIATLHSYQGSAQGTPALAMLPRTALTLTINFSFCLWLAVAACFPLANNKAQNLFGSSSHRSMSLLLLASSWDEHWSKKILSFQVYSPELYKYDMKRCNLISSALELDSGVTTSKPLPKHCRCCSYDHTSFEPSKCFARVHQIHICGA